MKPNTLFLTLAVAGAVIPVLEFVLSVLEHGSSSSDSEQNVRQIHENTRFLRSGPFQQMQTGPLPKQAYQKWNGGQNTDAKQFQTCTTPLVLIEVVGDQKADADAESGPSTSN